MDALGYARGWLTRPMTRATKDTKLLIMMWKITLKLFCLPGGRSAIFKADTCVCFVILCT